jgi:antitoxin (DNA-binding transcriptional repressor) of toxin-antitoxin stability system
MNATRKEKVKARLAERRKFHDVLRKLKLAKDALKAKLGAAPWLRGVGVVAGEDGMCLQVGVAQASDEVRQQIPAAVEGVPVQVAEVGEIVAQRAPAKQSKQGKQAARPRKSSGAAKGPKKASDLAQKARLRLEPGTFRVTFAFGPEELGIDCKPTPESIEKLGLQRALERLDRRDFVTTIALIARGEPDAENLARIRAEVLESTKSKVKKDGTLDLAAFGTTAGESDETQSGPVTTTEL